MHAVVGDELVIGGHRVGQPDRHGQVLEVRGVDGAPPYLVKWDDGGHATLLYPGNDCLVKHVSQTAPDEAAPS